MDLGGTRRGWQLLEQVHHQLHHFLPHRTGHPARPARPPPPRQACAVNGGAAVAVWGEAWELTQAHWVMNHDEPLVLGGFKPVLFATPFQRV